MAYGTQHYGSSVYAPSDRVVGWDSAHFSNSTLTVAGFDPTAVSNIIFDVLYTDPGDATYPNCGFVSVESPSANLTPAVLALEFNFGTPQQIRRPQFYIHSADWRYQFYQYPMQWSQVGYGMQGAVVTMDRLVPGGHADPVSGGIPQHEVPTVGASGAANDGNAEGKVLLIPAHVLAP